MEKHTHKTAMNSKLYDTDLNVQAHTHTNELIIPTHAACVCVRPPLQVNVFTKTLKLKYA